MKHKKQMRKSSDGKSHKSGGSSVASGNHSDSEGAKGNQGSDGKKVD